MSRMTFRLSLLGAVAAVLLCTISVFAGTEVVPTPEPAFELGLPEAVEMQPAGVLIPICSEDETVNVCEATDPCTGYTFGDALCCPEGALRGCAIHLTLTGCVTGVQAVCGSILIP